MKRFIWKNLNPAEKTDALARPQGLTDPALLKSVVQIMTQIKSGGDKALLNLTKKFDGVEVNTLKITNDEMQQAWRDLPKSQRKAINTAKKNIETFHTAQIPEDIVVETMKGVSCRRESRPIETAGLYVPGGSAPLVSTLLMLAVPAKVAGVRRRVVITPPGRDGKINSAILAAAYRCKVTDLFIGGGAQAIGALAYGTETIPKCDKIFGPGNAYVAAAKSLAAQEAGGPAVDMPAGPSEAMVVAGEDANPVFVASDLLSQAEHDPLAQVICIASSDKVADAIKVQIKAQIETLPRRKIAMASLAKSRMVIANERMDIIDIINRYAPEHLILQVKRAENFVPAIRNAGSIFLGPWTPESAGDYASGTNHTLPTYGAARAYSGVTLESFIKYISVQKITRKGLEALGPSIETLAKMEGLEAHRRAISLRLESKQK